MSHSPRIDTLSTLLHELPATGIDGFEGLVSDLLGRLTGLTFHIARSGAQHGRDARAMQSGGSIMVECKRYSEKTKLSDRDLLAELLQATSSEPNLDVWVLATTRMIPDQILSELKDNKVFKGIDIFPLESLPNGRGRLDVLCAQFPQAVIDALKAKGLNTSGLKPLLNDITSSDGFETQIQHLLDSIMQPSLGWPLWRKQSQEQWLSSISNQENSRARFHQPLNVLDPNARVICRSQAVKELNQWWKDWPSSHEAFVLMGEEGDGKSWAVAQWLGDCVQKATECMPPVLFFSSLCVGGETGNLNEIVIRKLNSEYGEREWGERTKRWKNNSSIRNDLPVAIVVFDGLNERHSIEYWRMVLESRLDDECKASIALICTARTGYWNEHFSRCEFLLTKEFILQPFNDVELAEALGVRNYSLEGFPDSIKPLLSKPRYLDLVLKHREKLSQSGDFTVARLIYEDWRDRLNRKDLPLSELEFNDFLKEIAQKISNGSNKFSRQDLAEALVLKEDQYKILQELTSGGVLFKKGTHWVVEEHRLALGLGLFLFDELMEANENKENLSEVIAAWLEPNAGLDIHAETLEQAALHSLCESTPDAVCIAILYAWMTVQNPYSAIDNLVEERITAYLPIRPNVYFQLAEKVWSSKFIRPWGQEILLEALMRWGDESKKVKDLLPCVLEKWLGIVPLHGPRLRRKGNNQEDQSEILRSKLSDTLGYSAENGFFSYAEFLLWISDDDSLLRLSRAALSIISHFDDRHPFMRAMVTGVLAEAINDFPEKNSLFAWIIRGSTIDVSKALLNAIKVLDKRPELACRQAASRLYSYMGTEFAWKQKEKLNSDELFPQSEWVINEAKKPYYEQPYTWTKEQCEDYSRRGDFMASKYIQHASFYFADPRLSLPIDFSSKLEEELNYLRSGSYWQTMGHTIEDHRLEKAEPVLARSSSKGLASFYRSIFAEAINRDQKALSRLAWKINEYELLLSNRERNALLSVWEKYLVDWDGKDEPPEFEEDKFLLVVLPLWIGNDQLHRLISRRMRTSYSLELRHTFVANNELSMSTTIEDDQLSRVLWYLIETSQYKFDLSSLLKCLTHDDELVRGNAFCYLYYCDDKILINRWISDSNWMWNRTQHYMEQYYGSLLVLQNSEALSLKELCQKISPSFWGNAYKIKCSAIVEWGTYAKILNGFLCSMIGSDVAERIPSLEIDYQAATSQAGPWISVQRDDTITDVEDFRLNQQKSHDLLHVLLKEAASNGNYWLDRPFPTEGMAESIQACPDLVKTWIEKVKGNNPDVQSKIRKASTFYMALCETLFDMPGWQSDAETLYRKCRTSLSRINIKEPGIELPYLVTVLMNAKPSVEVQALWEDELKSCRTDIDLLNFVLAIRAAKRTDSREWLQLRVDKDEKSSIPFFAARAITLRGFFEEKEDAQWLFIVVPDKSYWIMDVLKIAKIRFFIEKDACHWFQQFCIELDNDLAWAYFRLFLKCCDRRCFFWMHDEIKANPLSNDKTRFFRLNQQTVEKRCEENEKKWKEQFLGCKADSSLSPWIQF